MYFSQMLFSNCIYAKISDKVKRKYEAALKGSVVVT